MANRSLQYGERIVCERKGCDNPSVLDPSGVQSGYCSADCELMDMHGLSYEEYHRTQQAHLEATLFYRAERDKLAAQAPAGFVDGHSIALLIRDLTVVRDNHAHQANFRDVSAAGVERGMAYGVNQALQYLRARFPDCAKIADDKEVFLG